MGLETLRFCTENDEKCCTFVYIMSPEIICPNFQSKSLNAQFVNPYKNFPLCQSRTVKQLFSVTTSHL